MHEGLQNIFLFIRGGYTMKKSILLFFILLLSSCTIYLGVRSDDIYWSPEDEKKAELIKELDTTSDITYHLDVYDYILDHRYDPYHSFYNPYSYWDSYWYFGYSPFYWNDPWYYYPHWNYPFYQDHRFRSLDFDHKPKKKEHREFADRYKPRPPMHNTPNKGSKFTDSKSRSAEGIRSRESYNRYSRPSAQNQNTRESYSRPRSVSSRGSYNRPSSNYSSPSRGSYNRPSPNYSSPSTGSYKSASPPPSSNSQPRSSSSSPSSSTRSTVSHSGRR